MAKAKAAAPKKKETASVRLGEELRYRADMYATKHRRALRAVVDEAVEEYLKKRGA